MPDDPHVGRVLGIGLLPVAEQIVDDGIQPILGRIPWLEQVVVQADVVDRLDGDVGVGVRREQQELRPRSVDASLLEHLDARHLRHSLVSSDQRDRLVAQCELGQHSERLGAGGRPHDAVIRAVAVAQIARDRRRDHGIVVDGQDGRFAHNVPPGGLAARLDRRLKPAAEHNFELSTSAA